MLDHDTLYIVQEYIRDNRPTRARQIESEAYYNNEVPEAMNHDFFGLMVDEKVNYLLGKEPTLECKNRSYLDATTAVLGKSWLYDLQYLAREASVKAIAWLQFYIGDDGKLQTMVIPSEEIIPVWTDKRHVELDMVIRYYPVTYYEGKNKKTIYKVEVYTKDNVYFYEEESGALRVDSQKYLNLADNTDFGHFAVNGQQYSMGKPPFVWLKNNSTEKSDLQKIKDLVDCYNGNRKRLDNMLEDFKNFLVSVRGYDGGDPNEASLKEMLLKRLIFTDGGEHSGVDILTPTIDTAANDSHNQTLKDDIILFGQSVDRNKMQTGNAASGVALKTLYAGLDLKCNGLEGEFNRMFDNLQYFIKSYLQILRVKVSEKDDINIIFNRDVAMNETEAIEQCKNSVGVISNKTIVANHPWVKNLDEELKQIDEEQAAEIDNYKPKEVIVDEE